MVESLEGRTFFTATWTGTSNYAWSNPLNWNPQQTPDNQTFVFFPAATTNTTLTIDQPQTVRSLQFAAPYTVYGGGGNTLPLKLNEGITTTYTNGRTALATDLELTSSQTFTVQNSYFLDPRLNILGAISDGGHGYGLSILGGGTVILSYDASTYTGATSVLAGNLSLDEASLTSDVTVRPGGVFSGNGTVQKLTLLGGGLLPGNSTGTGILNTGDLSLASAATVYLQLGYNVPGLTYDQINVVGGVQLNGAAAHFSLSTAPVMAGNQMTVIQNDGADPISGTFAGLPEGATLDLGINKFRISYVGGTGNDVVLTALATATVAFTGTTTPAVYGTPKTFDVSVTGSLGTPTGTVSIIDSSTNIFTQPLDGSGHAIFNISTISAGSHVLQATYSGDLVYRPETNYTSLRVSDSKDSSGTTITATLPSVLAGEAAELKATVATSLGAPAKGKVTFFDGPTDLGFAMLDSSGIATLRTTTISIGHHVISATYAGDTSVLGSSTSTGAAIDIENNPPTTTGLSDIDITDGNSHTTLDLAPAFADIETADADLAFTITGNTNPSLVTTTLAGTQLTLHYAAGVLGSSAITVRATDANNDFVETTFNAAVSHIPASGTLQFSSAASALSETAGSIDLVINRTGGAEGIASAHYAVTGGTAIAGDDYALAAGDVTLADGEVSKSITMSVNNDALDEDDETIVISLTNPSGITTIGSTSSTTITIHDNGAPTVPDLFETHRPGQGVAPSPMYHASDPDGDPMTLSILTPPTHGTATIQQHPSGDLIVYFQASKEYGDDSLVYQVDDGHGHTVTGTLHLQTEGVGVVDSALSPGLKDLVVIGTPDDDDIELYAWKNTKEVKVMIGDGQLGHYPVTGRVLAFGMGGNDTIRARYIKQSVILSGGDGNDRLIGSGGKDILVGGDGNDRLQGYEKMDLFIGGNGADRIDGGAPDDIAIGGTSAFDALAVSDQKSLVDIVNAWNGSGKRTPREAAIGAGVGASGAKLNATTVFADNVTDDLGKTTTKNWIFGDTLNGVTSDLVRGRAA